MSILSILSIVPDISIKFVGLLLACYLAGTIPAAYLIVKLFHKKDVTKEGSGNVGTLNAFKVSNSKLTAVQVLLADFLKGAVPVFIMIFFMNLGALQVYTASLFILIGHNFNIWLRFKGGRGLASGAGIFAVINFVILLGWLVVWLIASLFKKGVLISNFAATLSLPLTAVFFKNLIIKTANPEIAMNDYNYFIIFVSAVMFIIILRHLELFKNFSSKNKNSKITNQ